MATIRKKGDKAAYQVLDRECLGRRCLALGHFQVRGATMSGSRNTGDTRPCCMTRTYHGCPYEDDKLLASDPALVSQRKAEGMKVSS